MVRKVLAVAVVALVVGVVFAQSKSVKLTGNLMDNACAGKHVADKGFADRAKGHATSCALMPSCESSGYGVYADGKFYKFDDAGNKNAVDILKNTETQKGVRVEVEGTISGDTIKVTKMTEVASAS